MRSEYNTRQKRELLKFLKDHDLENFTLDEIMFRMQDQGTQIGRTTVYRYLETLADQGNVRKYQDAQGVTQYQHVEDDARCASHFHMMCEKCGTLYHVDCDLMQTLAQHIAAEHGFLLNPRQTVLVGICAKCASNGEVSSDGVHCTEGSHGRL